MTRRDDPPRRSASRRGVHDDPPLLVENEPRAGERRARVERPQVVYAVLRRLVLEPRRFLITKSSIPGRKK